MGVPPAAPGEIDPPPRSCGGGLACGRLRFATHRRRRAPTSSRAPTAARWGTPARHVRRFAPHAPKQRCSGFPLFSLPTFLSASEQTQQRLPQVRMCLRVRNVSPECCTWLTLGSWGWGRLHSNVGHPISKRENPNLLLSSQFWPMWSKARQGLGQLPIGGSTLSGRMDG